MRLFDLFKPKEHQHKVIIIYWNGAQTTVYSGIDKKAAEKSYLEFREQWLASETDELLSVEWTRDGETYKIF